MCACVCVWGLKIDHLGVTEGDGGREGWGDGHGFVVLGCHD